jgi:hypothetical protein
MLGLFTTLRWAVTIRTSTNRCAHASARIWGTEKVRTTFNHQSSAPIVSHTFDRQK